MKDSYVRSKIVDPQLADVLLVPIEEIQQYLVEHQRLILDVEDLENRMEIKLQDDRKQRELEKAQAEALLNVETQRWAKRYDELRQEKLRMEEVNVSVSRIQKVSFNIWKKIIFKLLMNWKIYMKKNYYFNMKNS